MRRTGWGLVLVLCMLIASMGPVVAQDPNELPMCDPVSLEDLFPDLYGPETIDGDPTSGDAWQSNEDDLPTEGDSEPPPATEDPVPVEPSCTPFEYDLVFPVAGEAVAVSSFGAERSDHKHAGNDIAAAHLTPVVAAADGRVSWVASECCSLAIRHNDGWFTYYIHLNNDTYGTDDGLGWGIAPGLSVNSRVTAGQIIGWVGDSGNAEDSVHHLHFELRTPENVPIDPAASLAAGRDSVDMEEFRGPFADDDGSPFAEAISTLASLGLLAGCGDNPTAFCPDEPITGLQVSRLLKRITDLDITNVRIARIPEGPWQDSLISRTGLRRPPRTLDACALDAFCAADPISFSDLRDLAGALPKLSRHDFDTLITVDDLATSMVEQLDRPTPLAYCSLNRAGFVTKGQFAEMVARALGMVGPPPCDQIE